MTSGALPSGLEPSGSNQIQLLHLTLLLHTVLPSLSGNCMELCDKDTGEAVECRRRASAILTPALGPGLDLTSLSPLGLQNLQLQN